MVKYMNPIVVFFYDNGLRRVFQKVLSLMGDLIVFLRGYPIAKAIAHTSELGQFSGICPAGTLGTLITFYLPRLSFNGCNYGIAALPFTLILSGVVTGAAAAAFFIAKFPGGVLAFTVAAISEK